MTYFFAITGPWDNPDLDLFEVSEDGAQYRLVAYVSAIGGGGEGRHSYLSLYSLEPNKQGLTSSFSCIDMPGDMSYSDATQTLYVHTLLNPPEDKAGSWRRLQDIGNRCTIKHALDE